MTQAAISTGNQPVVHRRKLPTLVRSIQGALESFFRERKRWLENDWLVSFTRRVWLPSSCRWETAAILSVDDSHEKKEEDPRPPFYSLGARGSRTPLFALDPWSARGRVIECFWQKAFVSYVHSMTKWSGKGNHDDTGNPLRFWPRKMLARVIYRLWGKEKKFFDNFNIVFVIMWGIPQTPPVSLLLKEFIRDDKSPRFILIRNSIFSLQLYSLLRVVDFGLNFNNFVFVPFFFLTNLTTQSIDRETDLLFLLPDILLDIIFRKLIFKCCNLNVVH